MNLASSKETRPYHNTLYIINTSLSLEPPTLCLLLILPFPLSIQVKLLTPPLPNKILLVTFSSPMPILILMIVLPLKSILPPKHFHLESPSQTRDERILQVQANDHWQERVNTLWDIYGRPKSEYILDAVSEILDLLLFTVQSYITMNYLIGIALHPLLLPMTPMIQILLSLMPGEVTIRTIPCFHGSSRNVSDIAEARQKGSMLFSQSIGITDARIPAHFPSGSLIPDTTRWETTSLTPWRSCICWTSAGRSTIERVLCEISFPFLFLFSLSFSIWNTPHGHLPSSMRRWCILFHMVTLLMPHGWPDGCHEACSI